MHICMFSGGLSLGTLAACAGDAPSKVAHSARPGPAQPGKIDDSIIDQLTPTSTIIPSLQKSPSIPALIVSIKTPFPSSKSSSFLLLRWGLFGGGLESVTAGRWDPSPTPNPPTPESPWLSRQTQFVLFAGIWYCRERACASSLNHISRLIHANEIRRLCCHNALENHRYTSLSLLCRIPFFATEVLFWRAILPCEIFASNTGVCNTILLPPLTKIMVHVHFLKLEGVVGSLQEMNYHFSHPLLNFWRQRWDLH